MEEDENHVDAQSGAFDLRNMSSAERHAWVASVLSTSAAADYYLYGLLGSRRSQTTNRQHLVHRAGD